MLGQPTAEVYGRDVQQGSQQKGPWSHTERSQEFGSKNGVRAKDCIRDAYLSNFKNLENQLRRYTRDTNRRNLRDKMRFDIFGEPVQIMFGIMVVGVQP